MHDTLSTLRAAILAALRFSPMLGLALFGLYAVRHFAALLG